MGLTNHNQTHEVIGPSPRDRLIVPLDVSDVNAARALVERLGDTVSHYKIGHSLQFGGGLDLARELVRAGKDVFLDVKLHDIPNTIENGIARIRDLGVGFVTVHAYPQTMVAAQKAADCSGLRILGVTILTNMSNDDLAQAGYRGTIAEHVLERARQALDAGVHGIVCSPLETRMIREALGTQLTLVTPGIRLQSSLADDQTRIATPTIAMRDGSDYLVVGRPVIAAADPNLAASEIIAEISKAGSTGE